MVVIEREGLSPRWSGRERGDIEAANRLDDCSWILVEILYPMTGAHIQGQRGVLIEQRQR